MRLLLVFIAIWSCYCWPPAIDAGQETNAEQITGAEQMEGTGQMAGAGQIGAPTHPLQAGKTLQSVMALMHDILFCCCCCLYQKTKDK